MRKLSTRFELRSEWRRRVPVDGSRIACGNRLWSAANVATNSYTANCLNQYTFILRPSASLREITHDADGNMMGDSIFSFTYDAASRLKTVSSNGVLLVTNFYDAKSRRVKKVTSEATTTFFYDDWNLIEERIAYTNGASSTIHYYWGKDLSGTLQGAGGVGGLLFLAVSNPNFQLQLYVPCYDNIGNITRYLDANGSTVAQYTYDAFGGTLSQSGSLASFLRHRFSTKYLDIETGLYYYGYRFYSPSLMRWLNRDPLEEVGGINLYTFCGNGSAYSYDSLGEYRVNLPGIILDALCEDAYRFARKQLNTSQELRAWDRYTKHGYMYSDRDIKLLPEEVKFIAESIRAVAAYVSAKRDESKKGQSFSETKSFGGSAPAPWVKAIGGVSVKVTAISKGGCFSYKYDINDLYDFDVKGVPGFTSRSAGGEAATIMVKWAETCLKCDWKTFYHKGIYNGK